MKKINIKQNSLAWENLRETRIGSSEVFDIVKYYATADELQNCGINAESFREEEPYTTAWALYHKMRRDGVYKKEALAPEFAEYGHAVEPYGMKMLQQGRKKKLKKSEVYAGTRLIASLDVSGTAEKQDERPFDVGTGMPRAGQRFVCEQKSMMPIKAKSGKHMPFKYIIQAQYQITQTAADFFMLQVMVLDEDAPFIRGKICQMSPKMRYKYLDEHMKIQTYYFANNPHLARLIEVCIERFFADVDAEREPRPYIFGDSQRNIIMSIRLNTLYSDDRILDLDLSAFLDSRKSEKEAQQRKSEELQKIFDAARENNACRFRFGDTTAKFSKSGSLLVKEADGND